jgi:5-methylcytosine-specific restriction enzyme B
MTKWHKSPEVLEAAREWKERCLLADGSVLSAKRLWTPENLDHLDRYFVRNLDYGSGDFYQKLESQLAEAPGAAKQLAAELLWLLLLFVAASAIRGSTKRRAIRTIWEWSGEKLPENEEMLGPVLDVGVGNPGTAYNTGRWRELVCLIEAMRSWKALPPSSQREIAASGMKFAEWLDSVPAAKGRQLRHILLYLLFPGEFERIATARDKRLVVRAFRAEHGEDPDALQYKDNLTLDQELLRVREELSQEVPAAELDFYSTTLRRRWQLKTGAGPQEGHDLNEWYMKRFGSARVWLVATGEGGRLWPEFRDEGIVAVGFTPLGDLKEFESRATIHAALKQQLGLKVEPHNDSLAAWQFSREIQPGDYVLAKIGRRELVGLGRITSEYQFVPERAELHHIRTVEWERVGHWSLPESRRVALKTLTDVTPQKEWLRWADNLMTGGAPPPDPDPKEFTLDDAMHELFIPRETVLGIVDALARKKCVILEGPPGVGKTFVARRLAYALIRRKAPVQVELIQFHQSYAYEDFVQGWRPTSGGGFYLRNGVFYRFCELARQEPDETYVFVIDEINRANLSKVFGELMMLIEADKRSEDFAVQLTYSDGGDRFHVPPNVHVIGLMNTADRSLAMVDYALRRRFSFFRLEPAFGDEFAEHLESVGVQAELVDKIINRLRALNDRIREDRGSLGRGFEIGHSFFVPPDEAASPGEDWYVAVVRHEIEPLLQEYWFDQPERVAETIAQLLE